MSHKQLKLFNHYLKICKELGFLWKTMYEDLRQEVLDEESH